MTKSKLLRKSVATIIVVAVLLLSFIPIAAEEEVSLPFMSKDIYLNGVLINNYELNYPLVTRDGRTYLPLTEDLGSALGFQVLIDKEQQLIQLVKIDASYGFIKNSDLACNLQDQIGLFKYDYVVAAVDEFNTKEAQVLSRKWRQIISPVIWSLAGLVRTITNETVDPTPGTEVFMLQEDEILFVNDVPYIPLSAFRDSRMFEWNAFYDEVTGLYISTDSKVPAESYYSENNASYIQGRASYIRGVRPELSVTDSYYYEYIFRHEAQVYDVDQELLMAISRTESSFQTHIRSASGAVGMMQIMPKTAIAYQITELQLEDPHINVEFGTRYVRDRLWMFDGDIIKALAAYNQGVKAVRSGVYRTGYAEKCVYNEGVIKSWLTQRGYSHTFHAKLVSDSLPVADAGAEGESGLQIYR
jgi:hypothetical protein